MTKMSITLAVSSLILLVGCVQVDVTQLGRAVKRPPLQPNEVAVYRSASQVPGKYEEVAILTGSGDYELTSESEMHSKFRQTAAKLGANGVILDATSEPTTGAKVANWLIGTEADRKGKALAIFVLPSESSR